MRKLLVVSVLLLGCGDKKEPAPTAAGSAAKVVAEAAPAKASEDQAIGLVVEAYNDLTAETVREIIDAYFGSTGVGEKGPEVARLDAIRLRPLAAPYDRTVEQAVKKFADAKQTAPALPIADLAVKLGAAAGPLAQAYRDASRYYEGDEYKTDKGAKAAELHAKFQQAFTAYRTAQRGVAEALDAREQALLAQELAKFPPATYSHWMRKTLMSAKQLLAALKSDDPKTKLPAASTAFQQVATELDAFTTGKGAGVPTPFQAFRRMAVEMIATRASKIANSIADPKTNKAQLDGDMDILVGYYNNLVQMANSLFEMEANGMLQ
ncbi:MAG: DUF3829 domain-containing protein [Kofleriaceae bacterium]|nr:DUF3829 domain-containing protein [Kofleriaceae bacterium]